MIDLVEASFTFLLEEYGWAHLLVHLSEEQYRIDAISSCTEALPDLLCAGVLLSFGSPASVTFDHGGRETILAFRSEWTNRAEPTDHIRADLRCRVEAFEPRDSGPVVLFSALSESHEKVARALLRCGEKVWNDLGPEEYCRRWMSDGLPIRQLRALRASLQVES